MKCPRGHNILSLYLTCGSFLKTSSHRNCSNKERNLKFVSTWPYFLTCFLFTSLLLTILSFTFYLLYLANKKESLLHIIMKSYSSCISNLINNYGQANFGPLPIPWILHTQKKKYALWRINICHEWSITPCELLSYWHRDGKIDIP